MTRRRLLAALGALGAAAACGVAPRAAQPRPGTPDPMRIDYGDHPDRFGMLHLPPGDGVSGVVMIVHGGFWRQAYDLGLGTAMAVALTEVGVAAWNVEYRRVGGRGGFPQTFDDVAAAADALAGPVAQAARGRIDPQRTVVLGHSAGGHLAVWLASRDRLPSGAPGAGPVVRPRGVVSQAGVLDLAAAARENLGGGAVPDLLGGLPEQVPQRYALTSPTALAPPGAPVVCVHGTADANVPITQSERYVAAAGPAARMRVLDGVDHFAVIDPATAAGATVRDEVLGLL